MNSSLNVTAVITNEVAAVEVTGVSADGLYDRDFQGTGWSKKHPHDQPNEDIAYHLAMARALQDLANQYARQAASLAGFPVEIDLDGIEYKGEPVAIKHYPQVSDNFEEEVSY